jgi:nicotinamide riboside transporter PnuC
MRTSLNNIMHLRYKKRKRDTLALMKKPSRHTSSDKMSENLGWLGAIAVLSGYALLSIGLIKGDSFLYHGLMLIGSVGLAIITYRRRTYQPFIVNLVFSILAALAITRLLLA